MKKLKILSLIISALMILTVFSGCAGANKDMEGGDMYPEIGDEGFVGDADGEYDNGEAEDIFTGDSTALYENPFIDTSRENISTFSADVDTASYTYFRKLAGQGYTLSDLKKQISRSPLRTEEMINYFDYSYTLPTEGEVFGTQATVAKTPWNDNSYLLMLGIATEELTEKGANNLVFLIDVSGSMASADKLPLLKKAFANLVSALDERDVVSIVTYSGKEQVVLSGCRGDRDEEIMNAVNSLEASGSTNGEAGLTRAYSLAKDYFIEGGNNRIIMASDGDLNVGISSESELKSYIEGKRNEGIFLSVLGFGTGNYKDEKMSALAQNGNGVYYYIDGEREAEKVLSEDLLATLYTVAKDVKFQLEFDSRYVAKYRLIGYESRMLNTEDFDDDTKDAGDVGAGHSLTVCYELILTEGAESTEGAELASLKMRYKSPDSDQSVLRESSIGVAAFTDTPSEDFVFISSVIEATMILNGSGYNAKNVQMSEVYEVLSYISLNDEYKTEFKNIIGGLISAQR